MDKNKIILLNDIIYEIYAVEDLTEMRVKVLNLMNLLIPFNQATFYLADGTNAHILGNPIAVGICEKDLQKYLDDYEEEDYTRWINISGKCVAYRETDLFGEERVQEAYYQDVYLPYKIHYSLQISLAKQENFLGNLAMYRTQGTYDFTDEELFYAEMMKEHISLRLYRNFQKTEQHILNVMGIEAEEIKKLSQIFRLTVRESEVLGYLLSSLSPDQIGQALFISSNTLKKHTTNIYKK